MEVYFVISNSDGETTVNCYTKQQLDAQLNDEGWSKREFIQPGEGALGDTNYWNGKILIIKGEIVAPKAVTRVTQFEI